MMNWKSMCVVTVCVMALVGCGKGENDDATTRESAESKSQPPAQMAEESPATPEPPPPPKSFGKHVIPVEEDGPDAEPIIWDDYNINNVPVAPGLEEVEVKYDIPDHPAVKALEHNAFHVDPFYVERNSEDRETTPYSFRQFAGPGDIMSPLNWYRSVAFAKAPKPGGSTMNGPFADGCAATLNANNAYNYIVVSGVKHPRTGQVTVYILHYTEPDEEPHPTLLDISDGIRKHLVKLNATNWQEQESAADNLAGMGNEVVEPLLRCLTVHDSNLRSGAAQALAQIGKPAFEPMMKKFKGAGETYQQGVLQVFASTQEELPAKTVGLVLPLLEGRTRNQAVQVLGKIGDPRAVDPLIECLGDENQNVQRAAAKALGQIGNAKAVEPLDKLLSDENDMVRRTAVDALGQIGGRETWAPLNRILESEDTTLRKRAVRFVGSRGNEEAIPALLKMAQNDNSQQAVRAIGEIGGEKAVEALAQCLEHDDQNMRMVTIEVLGKLGGKKAIIAIKTCLDDENEMLQRWAKMTLKKLEETDE